MPPTIDFESCITTSIEASIAVKRRLLTSPDTLTTIAHVASVLVSALSKGNKVLLFGNGGSAADAQHIAAEFVGRFAFDRGALAALALTVDTSCITALGNDYGFDVIFSRQIDALARPGDVAIGISTSGTSPNVLNGLRLSRDKSLHTVALTGCTGGQLATLVDYCIRVPSQETPRIQECHIMIGHIISELVEHTIFYEQSCIPRP
jgi:D-sedoheptulose 7-phosphate isomerase